MCMQAWATYVRAISCGRRSTSTLIRRPRPAPGPSPRNWSVSGSSFGTMFRLSTFGESHGAAVGVVVDGCPAGLPLTVDEIQRDLDRRRVGQSRMSSARQESDRVRILSGLFEDQTTGTPIAMLVENENARPSDYDAIKHL